MRLLDDLKQQAEARQLEEQANEAEKNRNLLAVNVALRGAFQYFTELANSLNILKLEISGNFNIDRLITFDNLGQCDYGARDRRKTVNHQDYFEEASLVFRWAGSRNLVVEKDMSMPMLIQRFHNYLWGYNLRFDCGEHKNERGVVERVVFTIKPEVFASATFSGDWDTGKVRLTLKNVERLGSVDYEYDAAELDDALFEELAKLVLGRPNNLRNLGKHQEMLRITPEERSVFNEVRYPTIEDCAAPDPVAKSGLLDSLKSMLKIKS